MMLASPVLLASNSVFLAHAAAGGNTGVDCANAKVYTYFNSAGNWSATPTGIQIGPDTTVHLCDTVTASAGASGVLAFQGSGSSGHPVTLLFDSGAGLTAPYWGNGAITAAGLSFILLDGGTNGTIQATANGTSLANQQDGIGIYWVSVSDSEVKHMTVANMYVRTGTGADGANVYAMRWDQGSNVTFDGNTIHDTQTALLYGFAGSATSSNFTAFNNTIYNINWGLIVGDDNVNAILNGTLTIHDNVIHDFALWDDNGTNIFHHDGIYWFTNGAGSSITGSLTYNNYIYGSVGQHTNTFIFLSDSGGTVSGNYIFNNVLTWADTMQAPSNGTIQDWGQGDFIFNNTMIGPGTGAPSVGNNECISVNPGTTLTVKNNLCMTVNIGLYDNGTITASDFNDWYNNGAVAQKQAVATYTTLADWQACASGVCLISGSPDPSGINSNPNLTNFIPTGTSPLLAGTNLTGLGIVQLDLDKAGNARPSTGAWYIGAYQFQFPSTAGGVCSGSACSAFR